MIYISLQLFRNYLQSFVIILAPKILLYNIIDVHSREFVRNLFRNNWQTRSRIVRVA